jgi:ABC-2 type transport system permease protein
MAHATIVAGRILRELRRARRSLVFWALFPSLMLLLFGLIYAGGSSTGASFDYTAPGILIGAALFFSCLGGPIATIVAERERGTLRRLLLSPLSGASYFLGILLAYLVIAAGQTAIVYGIAYAFGASFKGSVFLGAVIVLLSVASYVGLAFFFGSRFARRTEDVNGPVAAIGVPLLVLGGTFFSSDVLPPYLLRVAHLNPVFHMNEALDAVSAEGAGWPAITDHLAFLVAFALVTLALGVRSYRQMLQRERVL